MQRYRKIRFLTTAERFERAGRWPWAVVKIYFALRRAKLPRRQAWAEARAIFHRWVWNWCDLPFNDAPPAA